MTSLRRVAAVALLAAALACGADLSAKYMAILKTPEGEATVFRDSVVITDGSTRITSDVAKMYERTGLAVISDHVQIANPDAHVWADSARYHLSDKLAELFGNVRVRQESLDIRAPRLLYRAKEKTVLADSGVALENTARSFRLTGRTGTYDLATDVGVIDSLPVLTWKRDRDSARVVSRRMHWYEKESRALAEGAVRMHSGATELECDTVIFLSGADSGLALGKPSVRDSTSRASGDSMTFRVKSGALDRVMIRNNASGEYRTEGGDFVVVAGSAIQLWVASGGIDRVEVTRLTSGQLIRTGRRQ